MCRRRQTARRDRRTRRLRVRGKAFIGYAINPFITGLIVESVELGEKYLVGSLVKLRDSAIELPQPITRAVSPQRESYH